MQNPYIVEDGERILVTEEGIKYLSEIVTDPVGSVYAFTDKVSPFLVAIAMARLSRSPLDLRKIFLTEFAVGGSQHAHEVADRVLTQFGDDSVKQLCFLQLAKESASNLLTKKLEWGRMAGYLEQSTRYIYFDKKNDDGSYRFFTPQLPKELHDQYVASMNEIFQLYSTMVRDVAEFVRKTTVKPNDISSQAWVGITRAQACDAVRPVLPAATTSTVGIVATAQSIENLILFLSKENLEECRQTGIDMLREVRKVAAPFFTRTDMPERGGSNVVYALDCAAALDDIAQRYFGAREEFDGRTVKLLDYWPHDEHDLISEILFRFTGKSVEQLRQLIPYWSEEKKLKVLEAFFGNRMNRRHRPGRALEKMHYEWEIVGDYGTFRDLQRHRMVDMWDWQLLTTAYGYEVPELVTRSGYEPQFRKCFALSDELYESLCEHDRDVAQYATLLGHRMRYRFMINAREAFHIHELRTGPEGHPGYRKIVQEMHRILCQVHPIIGAAMKFVNLREDPELTRLAGERAKQRKLALLADT